MEKIIPQMAIEYATKECESIKPDRKDYEDEEKYENEQDAYEFVYDESIKHFQAGATYVTNFIFWVYNNYVLRSIGCWEDGLGNLYRWEDLHTKYKKVLIDKDIEEGRKDKYLDDLRWQENG